MFDEETLNLLSEIANDYDWHIEYKDGMWYVKSKNNNTIFSSTSSHDVAFYMGGSDVC